jgi:hypothetical protein
MAVWNSGWKWPVLILIWFGVRKWMGTPLKSWRIITPM